jgi:hypothetical protein
MRFLLEFKFALIFAAVLTFCSVMVLRQVHGNQTKHVEVREAFIVLHSRGYREEAQRLYNRLLRDMQDFTNTELIDDFQRTLMLVDPATQQTTNLIWKYHWTVSNELERREASILKRAHEIAVKKG